MRGRDIPGYYYDEQKGKYFAIQPNHIAPPDAKYSRSNANEEQREAKRRRTQEVREKTLRKQTVSAAKLLKNPLFGGSGIRREHGDRPFAYYTSNRGSAFIHGLRSDDINLHITGFAKKDISILDAHYLPETSQSLMAISHGPGSHAIYCFDRDRWPGAVTLPPRPAMYAFVEPISVLTSATFQNTTYAIACTKSFNYLSGNAFVGRLPLPDQDPSHANPFVATGAFWNIGQPNDTLWDCQVSPENDLLAFAGTNGAVIHRLGDLERYGEMFTNATHEVYACAWLDCNTLAVGTRRKKSKKFFHEINLWDIRTEDSAARFTREERIVGIQNPNGNGNNLLVASNRTIDLLDNRMLPNRKDRPLLSLPHTSGSTRLQFSVHDDNLVAALDQFNRVQVYSLASGQHLREFRASGKGLLSNPRWEQDARGTPYLQVCGKNTILQWTWTGAEEGGTE